MQVNIDPEKLAFGLQRGLGRVEDAAFDYFTIPKDYRLRMPMCGLVSLAIQEYMRSLGVSTDLYSSSPKLPFDPALEHVVPLIDMDGGDPLVVEGTFSQFLDYVGLNWSYEIHSGERAFPEEKIMSFRLSESDVLVEWLTRLSTEFQARNTHPTNEYGPDVGRGPLALASADEIRNAYSAIWNPDNFSEWEPTASTIAAGKKVACYIPKRAIEVR